MMPSCKSCARNKAYEIIVCSERATGSCPVTAVKSSDYKKLFILWLLAFAGIVFFVFLIMVTVFNLNIEDYQGIIVVLLCLVGLIPVFGVVGNDISPEPERIKRELDLSWKVEYVLGFPVSETMIEDHVLDTRITRLDLPDIPFCIAAFRSADKVRLGAAQLLNMSVIGLLAQGLIQVLARTSISRWACPGKAHAVTQFLLHAGPQDVADQLLELEIHMLEALRSQPEGVSLSRLIWMLYDSDKDNASGWMINRMVTDRLVSGLLTRHADSWDGDSYSIAPDHVQSVPDRYARVERIYKELYQRHPGLISSLEDQTENGINKRQLPTD